MLCTRGSGRLVAKSAARRLRSSEDGGEVSAAGVIGADTLYGTPPLETGSRGVQRVSRMFRFLCL
eukprot:scaffold1010_cov334-Prasinococcus_capsulatus_cf.AAC.8